jgi:hypothetical protein
VALATAGAALAIDVSIKTATGQGSWTNIGIDAALLALPGAAHLARPLLTGTRIATTTTTRLGDRLSTTTRAAKAATTSITTDLKTTRIGLATTTNGITTIVKDSKTTGQMLSNAKNASRDAASWSRVSGIVRSAGTGKGTSAWALRPSTRPGSQEPPGWATMQSWRAMARP